MRKFSLVRQEDLDKINGNNIRPLAPERQVKAIRTWIDQNIKKYGPCGGQDTDEEMQEFIKEVGKHFNLWVDHLDFQRALKQQKGWANEWKAKVIDKNGKEVDFSQPGLRDATLQGVLKKIVEDGGKGHHGSVTMAGSHGSCLHWVSGSNRIFGTWNHGKLTLIGLGLHAGTSSTYNVNLYLGGSTTARTS